MTASCLIVDDEPVSRDVLKRYVRDTPHLVLKGECKDAFEASGFLSNNVVDLIFLDINMPRLSGISFAKSLSTSPLIIFTTAYPEYAVEGFDLNAIDYLVKPFSFERFLKAVNRALEKMSSYGVNSSKEPTVLIKSDKKIYSVRLSDILYIEGCGDYIKLFLEGKKTLIVHDTMKGFVGTLPENDFVRAHKSYALNISKIEYLEGNTVYIAGQPLPVSPNSKAVLLERLK